jgi:hypothetical protein
MKISLDTWARISEIGTAIIVVVSLIYIAVELDRNTRATYTTSWEAVNENLISIDIAEATEMSSFIEAAENDSKGISEEELFQFSRMAMARLAVIEYAYLGIRNETLNDYYWGAMSGFLNHLICKPGYRKFWDNNEKIFHPDYVHYVNGKDACE